MVKGLKVINLSMPVEGLNTLVFPDYPQLLKAAFTIKATHDYNLNI